MEKNENLFVTFADKNYIEQAKQLFSSIHHNAGWKGDYMLLAYKIPKNKLKWFRKKGILVKRCKILSKEIEREYKRSIIHALRIFTPEFKKWKKIIFIEGDTIVRASLDELTKIKGFAAVPDVCDYNIEFQFSKEGLERGYYSPLNTKEKIDREYEKIFSQLKKNCNVEEISFNFGVMAFDTSIIKKDTVYKIKKLIKKYGKISVYGPQGIANLLFYKKWQKLPTVYNSYVNSWQRYYQIHPKKLKGIIIHFAGAGLHDKPWDRKNPLYNEWLSNLKKADQINLKRIPNGKKWTKKEIKDYCKFTNKKHAIYYIKHSIDRNLGLFGILLRKKYPYTYPILKKLETPFKSLYRMN